MHTAEWCLPTPPQQFSFDCTSTVAHTLKVKWDDRTHAPHEQTSEANQNKTNPGESRGARGFVINFKSRSACDIKNRLSLVKKVSHTRNTRRVSTSGALCAKAKNATRPRQLSANYNQERAKFSWERHITQRCRISSIITQLNLPLRLASCFVLREEQPRSRLIIPQGAAQTL
jgi:hypothetical protein